jgi:SAM-dependent methyltransferase
MVERYSENAPMSEYDPFAEIYDEWSAHMTEDVAHYVALAREADGPIVELAVGNGRVAIPVARETGRKVVGIDLSRAMLALAEERAAAAGVDLELRQGDMRRLELDEPAGLIYSPFRSLLHMPTWADRRTVFERVAAALAPGGRFAWNAVVFDPLIAARLSADGVGQHAEGSRIWEQVEYDPTASRIDITAWVGRPGDGERKLSLWWVGRSEWEGLVDVAGLEVEALYGDFDRRPFDSESREFVWVARKPA